MVCINICKCARMLIATHTENLQLGKILCLIYGYLHMYVYTNEHLRINVRICFKITDFVFSLFFFYFVTNKTTLC